MAKAQVRVLPSARNTVMVVDDQSTGRAILEQVVRSLDERVAVEGFARPVDAVVWATRHVCGPGAGRLHDAGHGRHRVREAPARAAGLRARADRDGHGARRPQGALRGARRRHHRFPHQAGRRARMPGALPQPADAAPPAARARGPPAPARAHGRGRDARGARAREGDAAAARARGRVPRRGDGLPPDPHVALLAPHRQRASAWTATRPRPSSSPRRCTTSARSAFPTRSCSSRPSSTRPSGR